MICWQLLNIKLFFMAQKLWEKSVQVNKDIERFTVGRDREMDLYLAKHDVLGSMAHITMLESIGLLKKEELDQTLISGCRIFHFGSLSLTDEPAESATIEAVKMAKAAGALISYDPNYRPSLWKSKEHAVKKMRSVIELVDVMKVSDEESILLTGAKSYEQAAEEILAMGPKLVAITLGEHGVLMATKSRKEIIKAFKTNAVDTTGAGDSFWGGVLCSILSINKPVEKMEWEEIRKCAVLGNAVAGLCVQKRGGIPAIPTKEAVFEFMQK